MIHPDNQRAAGEAADLVDALTGALGRMAQARDAQDALSATASVERGRITVTVNASGSITRTTYADNVADLTHAQIARATLRAAQQAAAEVARKREELMAPFAAMRARLPKPEDLSGELAALRAHLPGPVSAPLTPPAQRTGPDGPEYTDVVPREPEGHRFLDR